MSHYIRDATTLFDIFETSPSVPEHLLLGNILGRAIFDLTPEANHLDRRDAIAWFRDEYPEFKEVVTSYEFIKDELNLGFKVLKVIDLALQEAIIFEDYYLACKLQGKAVNIKEWLLQRNNVRAIGKRPHAPRIRYRRRSYLPRDEEATCDI